MPDSWNGPNDLLQVMRIKAELDILLGQLAEQTDLPITSPYVEVPIGKSLGERSQRTTKRLQVSQSTLGFECKERFYDLVEDCPNEIGLPFERQFPADSVSGVRRLRLAINSLLQLLDSLIENESDTLDAAMAENPGKGVVSYTVTSPESIADRRASKDAVDEFCDDDWRLLSQQFRELAIRAPDLRVEDDFEQLNVDFNVEEHKDPCRAFLELCGQAGQLARYQGVLTVNHWRLVSESTSTVWWVAAICERFEPTSVEDYEGAYRCGTWSNAARLSYLLCQQIIKEHKEPPTNYKVKECRVKVQSDTSTVMIDGKPYPLKGGDKTQERLVAFIQALIDADGAPVSAKDHQVRRRDIDNQHPEVQGLINQDAKTGSGHRIPRDQLWPR